MIIAYETDDEAWAKWDFYSEGVDLDATSWVANQATKDVKADASATESRISRADNPVNLSGGALIGSFEMVASLLDQVRTGEQNISYSRLFQECRLLKPVLRRTLSKRSNY
jgi:pyrimidine oxygenase